MVTLDNILTEYFYKRDDGGINFDIKNSQDLYQFESFLIESGYIRHFGVDKLNVLFESADEYDDEYIAKSEPTSPVTKNNIVELLHKFGFTSDENNEANIASFNPSDIIYTTGKHNIIFPDMRTISFNELRNFLKTVSIIRITIAPTIIKVRIADTGEYDVNYPRVVEINRKSKNCFHNIYGLILICNELKLKIDLTPIQSAGIKYENLQVNTLNKILSELEEPTHLYIQTGGKSIIIDTHEKVDGAHKISGTGKADIALTANDKEVFWISYKHGAFFKDAESISAQVPFQQYGSLGNLYKRGVDTEVESNLDTTLAGHGILKNIIDKFLSRVISNSESIEVISPVSIQQKNATGVFQKLMRTYNVSTINLYKYNPPKSYYCNYTKGENFDNNIELMEEMVGKSLFGHDFSKHNRIFGRENVNMLIQTDKAFTLKNYKDGILIDVNLHGGVLENPNLPQKYIRELKDIINDYFPVLFCRYALKESFKFKVGNELNVIQSCRLMVMPMGKVGDAAIEIKL